MQQIYTYKGMTKDLAKSKKNSEYYYDALNCRIMSTDEETGFALTPEKGNLRRFKVTDFHGTDGQILHYCTLGEYLVLFVYYTEYYQEVRTIAINNNYVQKTIIGGNLNFSLTDSHFETETYYENENIQKVYWVDGINPLRYVNIKDPVTDISLLDACPSFIVSAPELESTSWGGIHTAGMIQYCYNLVVKNGAQTKISPRSNLIPLKKEIGGGDVNEIVGQINHIKIDNVDVKFDIIRVYAIKYTSYNQNPSVSLIIEENISKPTGQLSTTLRFSDDGTVISQMSEKELLFLGGENIIPSKIGSKFNYLILGDIQENFFDISTEEYDTRAYRFPKANGTTKIKQSNGEYKNIHLSDGIIKYVDTGKLIEDEHDCINDIMSVCNQSSTSTLETISPSIAYQANYTTFQHYIRYGVSQTFKGFLFSTDGLPTTGTYKVKVGLELDGVLREYTNTKNTIFGLIGSNIGDIVKGIIKAHEEELYPDYELTLENKIYSEYNQTGLNFVNIKDPDGTTTELGINSYVNLYEVTTTTVTNESALNYVYKENSNSFGATGTNINLWISSGTTTDKSYLLKSGEIYRFAIEFYNNRGQFTAPKWICDLMIPDGNFKANDIHKLNVSLSNVDVLASLGVVGWNLLRVERTEADRTIITQGIVNPSIYQTPDLSVNGSTVSDGTVNSYNTLIVDNPTIHGAVKMLSPFMRNMVDLEESESITTESKVPGVLWTALGVPELKGITSTPKIYRIQNAGIISTPVMYYAVGSQTNNTNLNFPFPEIFKQEYEGFVRAHVTYQTTDLFQLYSPEITFLNPIFGSGLKYRVLKQLNNPLSNCAVWGKQISMQDKEYTYKDDSDKDTTLSEWFSNLFDESNTRYAQKGEVLLDIKSKGHFNLFNKSEISSESYSSLHRLGLIGPAGGRSQRQNLYQYYRKYSADNDYVNPLINNVNEYYRSIAGNPITIGKGESSKIYNYPGLKNVELNYTFDNNLFRLVSDRNSADLNDTQAPIICVNSVGNNCLNIVDGDNIDTQTGRGKSLELILKAAGISGNATALIEITRILENQYGGNTYEARSRNKYLRIGTYTPLNLSKLSENSNLSFYNAGDIFVDNFRFLRVFPNVSQVDNYKYTSMCEIVEFPVESCINNQCRNDYSLSSWDTYWLPSFDEYHNYNRVYSQEPISNINIASPFTFEELKRSAVRLLSTKVKTAGEIVDGWTDVLVNEELNLNGQYGKLTKLIRNNDNLYFFQDNAVGIVQVQPRVAIQANDGIGVELGTGQILYNYQYISTASGSTNPNCIFNSPNYVYYSDVTNKTLNRVSNQGVEGISDAGGLHVYMTSNILSSYDNSYELVGVFDNINDEAYFTINTNANPGFTVIFNEGLSLFTSFQSFKPKMYFKVPGKIYSTNDSMNVWEHLVGDYGKFYDFVFESTITLFCNPQQFGNVKTRFDNIMFNAEVRDNDEDVFYDTSKEYSDPTAYTLPISKILVTSDYQTTLDTTLVWNSNIKRKFREWSIVIPRAYTTIPTLERIRGEWAFIKLTINNADNYKKIIHDIVLSYN